VGQPFRAAAAFPGGFGAYLYKFVKSAVKSGRYTSASEVVRDALREKRDEALREVQQKIEAGLASARRGDLLDGEAVMGELRKLGVNRRSR